MVVFVNPCSAGRTALDKWRRIEPVLLKNHANFLVHEMNSEASTQQALERFLEKGETDFIAAGGDGTVNALLNLLLSFASEDERSRIRFGAIGLGSSNDFHKPLEKARIIEGRPCKIQTTLARPRDVGYLQYEADGRKRIRYFIVNASIGVSAEANRCFNEPNSALRFLKRASTPAAILYAALKTITTYRNIRIRGYSHESGYFATDLTSLGIYKSRHFSGDLRYPATLAADDGRLGVFLAQQMTRRELLNLFRTLAHDGDHQSPKTKMWTTDSLTVWADHPFDVEYDGEIVRTDSITFGILPRYLMVCP
jgi:diacylglycerol kinase family enzyme